MTVADKVKVSIEKSSWIRKMFNEGNKLKNKYGNNNVFDFSLGNPNLPPPDKFYVCLKKFTKEVDSSCHSYMSQAGFSDTRKSVARYVSGEQNVNISEEDVIMTCGAAGALNVILKSILNPGDEVIVPLPYFVEYEAYIDNHGGVFKAVSTNDDFSLNIENINKLINRNTKAIIINSPNNPTGQIYSKNSIEDLSFCLREKSNKYNKVIYLISDEPYRKLVFDDYLVPSIFNYYVNSLITTSYSKDLSIPGERIGFALVNPKALYKKDLISAMSVCNRILGFVNAPALMQKLVTGLQGVSVDIDRYKMKRDLLCNILLKAGYEFMVPSGTFYVFPKSPIEDDIAFVRELQKELILVVPGSGFGKPGYFRIAFCVSDKTIIGAEPGFKKIIQNIR